MSSNVRFSKSILQINIHQLVQPCLINLEAGNLVEEEIENYSIYIKKQYTQFISFLLGIIAIK
jgi:hypothetical protein